MRQKKPNVNVNRYYNDEIIRQLVSLGCAFNVKQLEKPADPERCIINSLKFYWEYNDIFFMVYSLLKNRIAPLIHIERLVNLTMNASITSDERALLIALCNKLATYGDHRFTLVSKKLHSKNLKMRYPPINECSIHLIKIWGQESHLVPFGIKVRSFYEIDERKFLTLQEICKRNVWMKLRAIVGSNYRADIIYFKSMGIAKSAYQAAKMVGCNTSTATRIWKTLEYAPDFIRRIA